MISRAKSFRVRGHGICSNRPKKTKKIPFWTVEPISDNKQDVQIKEKLKSNLIQPGGNKKILRGKKVTQTEQITLKSGPDVLAANYRHCWEKIRTRNETQALKKQRQMCFKQTGWSPASVNQCPKGDAAIVVYVSFVPT